MKGRLFKNKLGAITIFIILGIVVLALVFLAFQLTNLSLPTRTSFQTEEGQALSYFVSSCLETSTKQAIPLLLERGLQHTLPEPGQNSRRYYYYYRESFLDELKLVSLEAPLFLSQGQKLTPSLSQTNINLARIIEDEFKECFKGFDENIVSFEAGEPTITAEIRRNIIVNMNFPLEIHETEQRTTSIKDFSTTFGYDLRPIHNFVNDFTNPSAYVPIKDLTIHCMQQQCTYEVIRISSRDIGYRLYYEQDNILEEDLTLNFIKSY